LIVLKIILWIILAIVGLIVLVCILPVGGEVSYIDGKLSYKVKLWLLNIMDSDGGGVLGWLKKRKKNKKPKKPKPAKDKKKESKKKKEEHPAAENIPQPDAVQALPEPAETSAPAEEVSIEDLSAEDAAALESIEEVPAPEETSGKKKKKKKKAPEEHYYEFDDEDENEDDDEEKKSLGDKVSFLIDVWNSAKRPLRQIFKGFKFSEVYIDFLVADEDAYDCAVKYGKYSGIIYNGIRLFSGLFTVRLKTVDIRPGFGLNKGRWDAAGRLKFRLGTAVIAGVWFLITFIFRVFIPGKLRARKAKKAAAAQK